MLLELKCKFLGQNHFWGVQIFRWDIWLPSLTQKFLWRTGAKLKMNFDFPEFFVTFELSVTCYWLRLMSIPQCIATEFLDTLCQLYLYKIRNSGQVLHCWSVVKTPCSILIWYLIESLRHNVLCLQISSFRLACVLGIITVAVLNVFWCWAVLDVVPQIDTCTTGEISAKSLLLGDNNTQSSISSCTPTNITLLQ